MNLISKKVEEALREYGSTYVEGFQADKVTKAMFKGDLTMKNIKLKPEAFSSPSLPVKLTFGTVEEINLMIPWSAIFTQPVIVRLSGVALKVKTKSLSEIKLTKEEELQNMLREIVNYTKSQYEKYLGTQGSIMNFWMVKNLVDRIIDNVQIQVRNIKLEVIHDDQVSPFCIEINMKDFELHTTDSSFMTKQFVKAGKASDETGKVQIFKVLNLTNFLVNVKPVTEENKIRIAYENPLEYNVFRLSFQVRLIKNSVHGDQDPDYEAYIKFGNNDLNLTQWQIQRIMSMLDFLKKINAKFEDLRASFKYKPCCYSDRKSLAKKRWQYAILEVVKNDSSDSKTISKGKFYSLVQSMNIDKLLDYDVPGIMMDVYEPEYNRYLKMFEQKQYNFAEILKEVKDDENSPYPLYDLMFIIPKRVQRVIISKFGKKRANKVKELQKNSWTNYALSFVPFMSDGGLSQEEAEIKKMLDGELGSEKKQFSKFILKLKVETRKGAYTIYGDKSKDSICKFGFHLEDFTVDLNLYEGKMNANVNLKGFQFLFSKKKPDRPEISFPVVKSTAEKGTNFLSVKFDSFTRDNSSISNVEVFIQHVDIIFVNSIISDLLGIFKVKEYDPESFQDVGNMGASTANAKKAISNSAFEATILVNILSPRLLIPMTKKLENISSDTNMFVFYLGDMTFMHSIKSTSFASGGNSFNIKLHHCKLEYWEDYNKAMKVLKSDDNLDFAIVGKDKTEPTSYIENFVILDVVAKIKYTGSADGRGHNISVLLDSVDFRINPYTYHQLLNIIPLVDLTSSIQKTQEQLLAYRKKIYDMSIMGENTVMKCAEADKYEMKHVAFTKNNIYVYNTDQDLDPIKTFPIRGSTIFLAQDIKTKGYIMKIWKDQTCYSMAYPTLQEAKERVVKLSEEIPSLLIGCRKDPSKSDEMIINLDLIVKKLNVNLFNEVFERILCVMMKYVEVRASIDQMKKIKVSFESLLVENFEKTFSSRGLNSLAWIGTTKHPDEKIKKEMASPFQKTDLPKESLVSTSLSHASQPYPWGAHNPEGPLLRQSFSSVSEVSNLNGVHKIVKDSPFQPHSTDDSIMSQFGGVSRIHQDHSVANKKDKILDNVSVATSIYNEMMRDFEKHIDRKNTKSKRKEEAFMMYVEMGKVLDVDLHMVNLFSTWDTAYVVSLQKKLENYIATTTEAQKKADAAAKANAPKKRPKDLNETMILQAQPDKLNLRAKIKIDRTCVICRQKNVNISDMVMVDTKVIFTQFQQRMLVNLYLKRFALRDLTSYPFTKKPEELKDYFTQKKTLMASFIESKKTAQDSSQKGFYQGQKDRLIEMGHNNQKDYLDGRDLDNNGIVVYAEVIGQDYVKQDRVATKAEIIVNNGEINFFMQPLFRFLDFLLVELLGFVTPDDSKTIDDAERRRRVSDIKKLNYNLFLKNTRVNLVPNFNSDKCMAVCVPLMMIMNEQKPDPTRNPTGQRDVPVWAETIYIQIKTPYIRGLKKDHRAIDMKEITVSMEQLMFMNLIEGILGKEKFEKTVEKARKLLVTIDDIDLNLRKDDFYALMTWVNCSMSYTDEMDDYYMVTRPDPKAPGFPQEIRVIMNNLTVNMMDDKGIEFLTLGYDLFFVDIKMFVTKDMLITIFGKGLHGDVTQIGSDGSIKPLFVFLRELEDGSADVFSGKNVPVSTSIMRRNQRRLDRKFETPSLKDTEFNTKKTVAEKLVTAMDIMQQSSVARFFMQIEMLPAGQGMNISITLKQLGINPIIGPLMNILGIIAMTPEQNMNRIIRPSLTKGYGSQNININMESLFIFLQPPKNHNEAITLHIPEMSLFMATKWHQKTETMPELKSYFDSNEYLADDNFHQIAYKSPEKMVPVSQMGIAINDMTLEMVPFDRLSIFVDKRIQGLQDMNLSRNIIQPYYVAYQTKSWNFSDTLYEYFFSRGVAKIGAINILTNVDFLDYMMKWQTETTIPGMATRPIKGKYHDHVSKIIKEAQISPPCPKKKVAKSNLDIIFQGLNLTMLDDIYNTNMPLMNLSVHPITTSMVNSAAYSGIKDLGVTVEANVFNYNSQNWEPILENFSVNLDNYTENNPQDPDKKTTKTVVSFSDRDPAINLTTELEVLLTSLSTKLFSAPKQAENADFEGHDMKVSRDRIPLGTKLSKIKQEKAKPYDPNQSELAYLTEFDRLAIIDKEKIASFITSLPNRGSHFANTSLNMTHMSFNGSQNSQLEQTALYGYNDQLKSHNPDINAGNFNEMASLKPQNPLNFRFREDASSLQNNLGLPENDIQQSYLMNPYDQPTHLVPQQHQSQYMNNNNSLNHISMNRSNQMNMTNNSINRSTNSANRPNPLLSRFDTNKSTFNYSPEQINHLKQLSDQSVSLSKSEVFLREVPFIVDNMTGRDILFDMQFFDLPKTVYVRNMTYKAMEYPFTLENTLIHGGYLKSRNKHINFRIFEVDEANRTFMVHQGSDIHTIREVKVPYGQSSSKEEADLKYLIFDTTPLIMKKHILIKSPLYILNECESNLQVHFYRNNNKVYSLQTQENVLHPVPVDLLDTEFQIEMSNTGTKIVNSFSCLNSFSTLETTESFKINEVVHANMWVEEKGNCRYMHITPGIVMKNLFVSNLNVYVQRKSIERAYNDEYLLSIDEKDLEIYTEVTSRLKLKAGVKDFISRDIDIDLDKSEKKEIVDSVWMMRNNQKKFKLNYSVLFRKGTYLITFFAQHVLFDELFTSIKFNQKGERFEDDLINVEELREGEINQVYSTILPSMSVLPIETTNQSSKTSRMYLVPFPRGDVVIGNQRDQYEMTSVSTNVIGTKEKTVKTMKKSINRFGNYDIASSDSIFRLSTIPSIMMNITNVRHKYLIKNLTGNAISVKQLNFDDSVEMNLPANSIKPIFFAAKDQNAKARSINIGVMGHDWSKPICISTPSMEYFMLKNSNNTNQKKIHHMILEDYITLSTEIVVENSTYIIVVRKEPNEGSFKLINDLHEETLFFSQDPQKLEKGLCEIALKPSTYAHYSWPNLSTKNKNLFMCSYSSKTEGKSRIMKVSYQNRTGSYDFFGERAYHESVMSGATNMITFSEILKTNDNTNVNNSMQVMIPKLGFSLIGGKRSTRRELLFTSIHDMALVRNTFDKVTKTYVKLRYFNIDNASEFVSYYPILLSPKYSLDAMRQHDWYHFDIFMKNMNPDPKEPSRSSVISKIDARIIGSQVKLEESFMHNALDALEDNGHQKEAMNRILNQPKNKRQLPGEEKLRESNKDKLFEMAKNNYKNYDNAKLDRGSTYINEVFVSDHDMNISFKKETVDDESTKNEYSAYIKSLGFDYMFSISDLSLEFKPFEMENGVYPIAAVQKEVTNQYTKDGISSAMGSLFDLKILGQPRTFLKTVNSTNQEYMDQPTGVNEDGPNQIVSRSNIYGQGTKSLTKNVGYGTLTSLSAITGSAATITSKLTLDKEYQKERTRIKSQEANKVMNNMNVGTNRLGFAMKDSISGVFTRPVEMTEKQGLMGAIKGSFIGFGGLILKPVTGLFDFVSSGAEDAAAKINPNPLSAPVSRIRNPRAFYGETSSIKLYNDPDAEIYNMLENKSRNKYDKLLNTVQVTTDKSTSIDLLVNTVQFIYCVNPIAQDIHWALDKEFYHKVMKTDNSSACRSLSFKFRDHISNTNSLETVNFYSPQDMDTFWTSLNDKK